METITANPLAGQRVVELVTPQASSLERIAISFAGKLLAGMGAELVEISPARSERGGDTVSGIDLAGFLGRDKKSAPDIPDGEAALLTDDRALMESWTLGSVALIEATRGRKVEHSALSIMAASGLLDIFGSPEEGPLALPGHQPSYTAGVCAFNAMVGAIAAEKEGRSASKSEISILDAAFWVNWKHYLASHAGLSAAGIGRAEDWATYRCRDGYVAVSFQDRDMPALARLMADERLRDDRFKTLARRRANIADLRAIIAAYAIGMPRDEIVRQAAVLGLPIGPVLGLEEVIADPQMAFRGFIAEDGGRKLRSPAQFRRRAVTSGDVGDDRAKA